MNREHPYSSSQTLKFSLESYDYLEERSFSFVVESLGTHQGRVKALSGLPNAEGLDFHVVRIFKKRLKWKPSSLGGTGNATNSGTATT